MTSGPGESDEDAIDERISVERSDGGVAPPRKTTPPTCAASATASGADPKFSTGAEITSAARRDSGHARITDAFEHAVVDVGGTVEVGTGVAVVVGTLGGVVVGNAP
jgi:hypothetical protein